MIPAIRQGRSSTLAGTLLLGGLAACTSDSTRESGDSREPTESLDVVINFLGFELSDVQADYELFKGRVRQYLFISSATVYEKPPRRLPITEAAPLGIFTERDAVFRVIAKRCDPETTRLSEVMTPSPLTVEPDRSFGVALRLMHESGLVPRRLAPHEEGELIAHGLGLTNLVDRVTRGVSDLTPADLERGRVSLAARLAVLRPRAVVFVGVTAYRAFAGVKGVVVCGEQEAIDAARVFVVPSPSGRNAHYRYEDMLGFFRGVARALGR